MHSNRSWCRTELSGIEAVSSIDLVYAGLSYEGGENVALHHLRNSQVCDAFVSSLCNGGFNHLERNVQVCMILQIIIEIASIPL